MNYQIITDSCCDFPKEMYDALNVKVAPLTVCWQGSERDDANDDSLKVLYDAMRNGESATTSAVNPQRWAEVMEPSLREGKDILVMAFSSALSTTYQSAVIAAEELMEKYPDRKILVCDTLAASLGQGLLVWYACRKRDAGMSLKELYCWVEENKRYLCMWFTVDDLMHLKRGGRVSSATALVGTMLQIKPVLHVDDAGRLINVDKTRGRKAAIRALLQRMEETALSETPVFISHGDCAGEAEELAAAIRERFLGVEPVINFVGPVIGSHSGPGTVALFFLAKRR